MKTLGHKLLLFWQKHERVINVGGLVLGFSFDLWIAKKPDSIADNILLLTYLVICAVIITILNIRTLRRKLEKSSPAEPLLLLLLLQFCFGGLANNMLILYGKSGTLGVSAVFVALLGAFALGNEFLKGRYEQLRFNIGVYYFLLLTYCTIAVPTFLLHQIGAFAFIESCLVSVFVISIFLLILYVKVFTKREGRQMLEVVGIVASILIIFNGLYFLNIIPPVPLSLKQIGIYHSLQKDASGGYTATFEPPAWYVFWRDTASTYALQSGSEAYCFSAVYAPGKLSTPIVYVWEKYNEDKKQWEKESSYTFPISGGREGGYRGWSEKTLSIGHWRCDVKTANGQLVGRISFDAKAGMPLLSTTTL